MNRKKDHKDSKKTLTRREFIGRSAATAAGFMIIPRHVLGGAGYKAPSDTLNIGCIGVGGKGSSDIRSVSTENIVALCDVDGRQMADFLASEHNTPEQKAMYEKANKYKDFRVLLDKEKNLDAVTVTTPDHTHAVIAMNAIRRGKHVFVQKPLTHT
ncbi:MAG: Gfo/Idh/MocA family protein, partial [Acidobacteriota bacterium]